MAMQTTDPNDEPESSCSVASNPRRPLSGYPEALHVLLADGVVFAHKLSAADWSVEHEGLSELHDLFLALGEAAERMNGDLLACAAEASLKPTRPLLADAFEVTRFAVTAPVRPPEARAEDALEDIKYLNARLRGASQVAEQAGQVDASRLLLASAGEIEGFGWLLAAWLN